MYFKYATKKYIIHTLPDLCPITSSFYWIFTKVNEYGSSDSESIIDRDKYTLKIAL